MGNNPFKSWNTPRSLSPARLLMCCSLLGDTQRGPPPAAPPVRWLSAAGPELLHCQGSAAAKSKQISVSAQERSNNSKKDKSSDLELNSPLLQSPVWPPLCYPASEGYSLSATGPERNREWPHEMKREQPWQPMRDFGVRNMMGTNFRRSGELTAKKSGLSWMALDRSGRADLDFPIARNTAARL